MKVYNILIALTMFFGVISAEITKVNVQVDGMVCTACVSIIKRALLEKIPEISEVKKIDLGTGFVELLLKKGNGLTRDELRSKLDSAVEKSTYKFKDLHIEEEK